MDSRTLSIRINFETYNLLQEEVGKGKISNFIESLIKEKFDVEKSKLANEYQEAWENKDRWNEFKDWEKISLIDRNRHDEYWKDH